MPDIATCLDCARRDAELTRRGLQIRGLMDRMNEMERYLSRVIRDTENGLTDAKRQSLRQRAINLLAGVHHA